MVVCTSGSNDVGDAFSCVNSLISKMGTKSGEMRLSCRIDGSDLTVSKAGNSNSAFFLRLIMFLDSLTRGGRALIKFVFTTFQWKLALTMTVENTLYRPGQPNQEYTMWTFEDFSVTQILREINFGHFEAPKNCHSDHKSSSEF